ncbi:MAG: hypothetical protein ACD_29C00062G0002 [uncultured bacterium]|nr:MAG: hypothetical protein ACD_29C00062G0002 [uncultured bacterium]
MRKFTIFIFSLFLWMGVFAIETAPLNPVTLTVPDRSKEALQNAFKIAFAQFITKMSGDTHILTVPAIQAAENNASEWVQNYTYEIDPASSQLQLQIVFDASAIQALLKTADHATWHQDRPLTLIYFQATPDILKNLQASATQSSSNIDAPIIFPELDLTDENIINNADQNTFLTTAQLQQLGQRYGVLSILDAQILQQPDQTWRGNFNYFFNNDTKQFSTTGATSDAVVTAAINKMVQYIINPFETHAILNTSPVNAVSTAGIKLEVMGINDIADYAKIIRYLKQMDDVASISVKDMNPAGMLVQINLKSDMAEFQKTLATEGQMKPVDQTQIPSNHPADLYYSWNTSANTSTQTFQPAS